MVVSKPAGLQTQAPGTADSLEQRLRQQFRNRSAYLAFPHRLDRPVGGVILVALRKRAASLLGAQFMSRKVEKVYLAVLQGHVDANQLTWTDSVRKIPEEARVEITDSQDSKGLLAETGVELVRYDEATGRSWVRLSPLTGRMHQLRIQAASRGVPIVGDVLYGGPPLAHGDDRIMLCAHSIRFFDPRNSRSVTVTASDNWIESV